MSTCLGCGATLVKRQKVYCSVACQMRLLQRQKLERWLSTGEGVPVSQRNHYIRNHLFQAQAGLCAICGMPAEWNTAPLVFVLDHIDGNASNNHRENLRLVCPNCDSQLPTYKSRNRGNGRAWRKQRYADGKSY